MIRIGAVGDIHIGTDSRGRYRAHLEHLAERADLFLVAGDLTHVGSPEEAEVVAEELGGLGVPTIAVLGNHDLHADSAKTVVECLEQAGVRVIEGDSTVVDVDGIRVGVAGAKGFGGGFPGAQCSDFGEPEMKAFIGHSREAADSLRQALEGLDTDVRVALMHYAPVVETLLGERLEIYPFLGSYLLAEAIDAAGADLALHGHAHGGSEKGMTPGGVPVRNVAQPVIRRAYQVYCLEGSGLGCDES